MKKHLIILAAFVSVFSSSCKKSSSTTPPANNTNNNNTMGLAYGVLIATRVYEVNPATHSLYFLWNTGNAYFFSNPNSPYSNIYAGNIFAGSKKFRFQSFNSLYIDSTDALSISPTAWQVTGAGTIPSFTYTNNDSLPGYTGCALLPDTIYRNQNLNLQINGVSGATSVEVILSDGTSSIAPHQITQVSTSVSANNIFPISSSSLSGFTPYSTSHYFGSLQINIQKNNNQVFSGKTFEFGSQIQINKNVYIK